MHKLFVLLQINDEIFKEKIIKLMKSVFSASTTRCKKFSCMTWIWSKTDLNFLLVEENSILLVLAAKVRLLKMQDANYEQKADKQLIKIPDGLKEEISGG